MTLREYVHILRKRWWMIAVCAALGAVVAVGVTHVMPPSYAAQTKNFVSITAQGSDASSLYESSQFALKQVASYTQVVDSPAVLAPVIKELDLDMSTEQLAKDVSATNPPETVLIFVQARASSSEDAQRIANAVSMHLAVAVEDLETPRSGGVSPVKVSMAVPATMPNQPVSPRPVLNLALGLLVGLALGIGVAILREQFDTSVKTSVDLERLTGQAPLGTIPKDRQIRRQPLMALPQPDREAGVEAFRSIRTNLQFVDVDSPPRQVVITSSIAEEGKTVTACNLAITMSQSPTRVCLVEADLRRPRVAEYLGIEGSVGLTNVVAGQHSLDDALTPWMRGRFMVLPAGTAPPDPSQLLGSHAMEDLLAELRSRFDLVLLDAPPLLPVSDAAVLARLSDGAVLISRYGRARREQVTKAVNDLSTVNARLIGTVLTCVPSRERAARYGKDYGDGYSGVRTRAALNALEMPATDGRPKPVHLATASAGKHDERRGA